MAHNCPACHHAFEADALAGVVCCPRCARSFDIAMDSTAINDSSSRHWAAASGAYFAQYKLERKIGQGGMSEVWAAEKDGQQVVLKILLPHVATNDHIRKRFRREIDSLQRFQHPHIIPIVDHGEANGRLYYVTTILAKRSLRQRMDLFRTESLTSEQLQHIAVDCLQALAHAHDKQIIHRDIKPENILELDDGSYALSDFGIAQVHSTHDGDTLTMLTNTNVVLGTYAYMAPEQSRGSRDIDARADLYALGVVLYECLSGHLPEGRFEDPEVFMRGWPQSEQRKWNTFILCLLERDPEKRYRDAHIALKALNAKEHKTVEAEYIPGKYTHGRQLYRHASHGWFGGVCSGLGAWSGIDPGWIRLGMSLGVLFTGGIMFIAYIFAVVLIPNCPDPEYKPHPLNAALPQRGNGWFLGVCDMLGQRSSNPDVWRLIFVLLCFFSGFTIVLPYLAIGIFFPPSERRARRIPTQRHRRVHEMEQTQNQPPALPSMWPSFLSALPAALGFGFMSWVFIEHSQMALAAVFGGFTIYFASQLHTRAPLTPVNFRGLGSGAVIGGLAILIGLPFVELQAHSALINSDGSISSVMVEPVIGMAFAAVIAGVIWGLLRGYYGPMAQAIGAMPVILLLTLPHYPQLGLPFITYLSSKPVFFLIIASVLWLVSASVTQSILRWIINAPPEKSRHYSLSASIIGVALIMASIVASAFQIHGIRQQQRIIHAELMEQESGMRNNTDHKIYTTYKNSMNKIEMNGVPHVIDQYNNLVPINGREIVIIDKAADIAAPAQATGPLFPGGGTIP